MHASTFGYLVLWQDEGTGRIWGSEGTRVGLWSGRLWWSKWTAEHRTVCGICWAWLLIERKLDETDISGDDTWALYETQYPVIMWINMQSHILSRFIQFPLGQAQKHEQGTVLLERCVFMMETRMSNDDWATFLHFRKRRLENNWFSEVKSNITVNAQTQLL